MPIPVLRTQFLRQGPLPRQLEDPPEEGVRSRVSGLRERGEEPPDDLISGAGLTPSFLQDVPEYTDHPSLIWEGVGRSLNTRRTASMSVLCPSPHPGAGEWMRDVVVRRMHGWTLEFSRSPLGRRRGGGL